VLAHQSSIAFNFVGEQGSVVGCPQIGRYLFQNRSAMHQLIVQRFSAMHNAGVNAGVDR
jgi:hypothetical protein